MPPSRRIGLLLGLMLGASLVVLAISAEPQQQQYYQNQIITNTQKILDQEKEIEDLRAWRNQHTRDSAQDSAASAARVREIEVTLAAHDRALWVLISGVVLMSIKMLADIVVGAKKLREHRGEQDRREEWERQQRDRQDGYRHRGEGDSSGD